MRVLIVDDHELIHSALLYAIQEADVSCSAEMAVDLAQAAQLIDQFQFDLVLLDLGLPGQTGLSSLVEFRQRYPELPVVVVSALSDRASILQAINLGAMGYVPKSTRAKDVIAALRIIVSGGVYVPSSVLLGSTASRSSGSSGTRVLGSHIYGTPPNYGMTPAQLNVLRLLLRGLPNKLIARELDLKEATVKSHLKSIYAALDVHNRTQAVLVASELGIGAFPDA